MTRRAFRIIAWLTVVVTLTVVVFGAYVRLSDAGLGCPDWPGCYGELFMSDAVTHAQVAEQSGYERPYEHDKAWKEMIHRYLAGFLGLLILALAIIGWRNRQLPGQPYRIPVLTVGLVIFQAALGMWTVTLLVKPAIVTAHLLGGMAILALLFWTALRTPLPDGTLPLTAPTVRDRRFAPWAALALIVVFVQISLGGWVSTNYAALACADFPTCQGEWWPSMDFGEGFRLWRGLGINYEYGVLDGAARTAIQVVHRIGALVTLLAVGFVALRVMITGSARLRWTGVALTAVLLLQLLIGIANIIWLLPLPLAVAHNAGAALLLLTTVLLLHQTTARNPDNFR